MIIGDNTLVEDDAVARVAHRAGGVGLVPVDRFNKPSPDTVLADMPAWRAADFIAWRLRKREEDLNP